MTRLSDRAWLALAVWTVSVFERRMRRRGCDREQCGMFPVTQPAHIKHRGRVAGMRHGIWYEGPYFAVYGQGGGKGTVAQWQKAMGIDWTDNRKSIAEAIPPAYSAYVGKHLLEAAL